MDPWDEIGIPAAPGEITARRYGPNVRWDWYRGRDSRGRCLLFINTDVDPSGTHFPVIQGLEVRALIDRPGLFRIQVALNEPDAREPFGHVCDDLVDYCEHTVQPEALPRRIAERLEVWRRLWRRQRLGILSEESQRGLLAELLFLRDIWLGVVTNELNAVETWEGPDGGSQDFRHGFQAVEVKSRPPSRNSVLISSADQLWFDGNLYLVVYPIATVGQIEGDALSLNQVVESVRTRLASGQARDRLDIRLIDFGYINRREYDEERFVTAEPTAYHVGPGFPALQDADLPPGVESIRYSVNLNWCEEHRTELPVFQELLRAGN
ncbi:PD-(D/E)XK motif protein [Thioalkalivibrio sp. ALJ9]|uniref:PD-(D/E)XK motif protein n=1 Tax=Thioalkalivibrio sp. ALJ9 TaxID=1158758 RepID=UPI0009D99088|nr:PD-(D/E)XK motif protein [Thioalkalivibrio sp. ALJ9]